MYPKYSLILCIGHVSAVINVSRINPIHAALFDACNPSSFRISFMASITALSVRSLGRNASICNSRQIVAGRLDNTSTRSASCAASSISCVTKTTVRGRFFQQTNQFPSHTKPCLIIKCRERFIH